MEAFKAANSDIAVCIHQSYANTLSLITTRNTHYPKSPLSGIT